MKINWRKSIAVVAVSSVSAIAWAGTAGAASLPTDGQDCHADTITGGGSDTTFVMENALAKLYSEMPGGQLKASPNLLDCVPGSNPQNNMLNNDHDLPVNAYPAGSGAGISNLGGIYDFARSSRVLTGPGVGTELDTKAEWGYGKDGLAIVTPGTRPTNLTTAQLKGIYNGTFTTWDQITGLPADVGHVIHAYGMQTSSGTYGTFKTWLGFDPNDNAGGKGAPLLPGPATYPFENDLKPVIADITARGWIANDTIWWASYGELKTYPFKADGANNWKIDNVAPSNSSIRTDSYHITRFLWRDTLRTDVQLNSAGTNGAGLVLDTTGGVGGKSGAVRHYTEVLCQPAAYFASAPLNPFTGVDYFTEITNVIANNGFQRTPVAAQTAGACKAD